MLLMSSLIGVTNGDHVVGKFSLDCKASISRELCLPYTSVNFVEKLNIILCASKRNMIL